MSWICYKEEARVPSLCSQSANGWGGVAGQQSGGGCPKWDPCPAGEGHWCPMSPVGRGQRKWIMVGSLQPAGRQGWGAAGQWSGWLASTAGYSTLCLLAWHSASTIKYWLSDSFDDTVTLSALCKTQKVTVWLRWPSVTSVSILHVYMRLGYNQGILFPYSAFQHKINWQALPASP